MARPAHPVARQAAEAWTRRPEAGSATGWRWPAGRRPQAGLSLVELMLALLVLVVGVLGAQALVQSLLRQGASASETELAAQAIASKLEEIRGHFPYGGEGSSVYDVFAGQRFDVPGLAQADGSPAGLVRFLDEQELLAEDHLPGLLLDIDGDGVTAETQAQEELRLAVAAGRASAVRVEVSWSGREGSRTIAVAAVVFRNEGD